MAERGGGGDGGGREGGDLIGWYTEPDNCCGCSCGKRSALGGNTPADDLIL